MEDRPLVSICCITYNHGEFIRQCLDGFLMQKTNFQYEILIHDDASTDATAQIIREYQKDYPEIIKPIFQKENQYSRGVRGFNIRYNFTRCLGDYIALCEGDDYWTDPFKLQKQVDFLKAHEDFSLACGGVLISDLHSGIRTPDIVNDDKQFPISNAYGFEFSLMDLHKRWLTKTLTVLFRTELLEPQKLLRYKNLRDVHLFYHLIKRGRGFYFQEIFGVYNMHSGGVYSSSPYVEKIDAAYEIYKELHAYEKDSYTKQKLYQACLRKLKAAPSSGANSISRSCRIRLAWEAIRVSASWRDTGSVVSLLIKSRK